MKLGKLQVYELAFAVSVIITLGVAIISLLQQNLYYYNGMPVLLLFGLPTLVVVIYYGYRKLEKK